MYDDMWSETQNLGNWSGLLTGIKFHLAKGQSDLKQNTQEKAPFSVALSCSMVYLVPTVGI